MSRLKVHEELFINEYIKNGGIAVQAYLFVRPKCKYNSAKVNASRMLSRINIQEEIQSRLGKSSAIAIASRENLIRDALKLAENAIATDDLNAGLKSLELIAKMQHFFNAPNETDNYLLLMQRVKDDKLEKP